MQLLKNYLAAVGRYLPDSQREDILNELSANLLGEIDDRQVELRRPVAPDEIAAILKAHGHPLQVAGRYAAPRSLIGPELFPIYSYVMRRALPIAALVYGISSAVGLALGPHSSSDIVLAVLRVIPVLLSVAAWMTAAFAAFEYLGQRYGWKAPKDVARWDPLDLPAASEPGEKRWALYAHAGFFLAAALWIALVPRYPFLLLGPGARLLETSGLRLAPVWTAAYWPVLLFLLARGVVQLACAISRPRANARAWIEIGFSAVSLAGFAAFLSAGDYFIVADGSGAASAVPLAAGLTKAVQLQTAICVVVAIAAMAKAARRIWAGTPNGPGASLRGDSAQRREVRQG